MGTLALDLKASAYQRWPELLFAFLLVTGILIDLWLVFHGYESISQRTWLAQNAHPTLIAAGVLAGTLLCLLVRKCWVAVMVAGMLTGHLFIHY